jgi:hypothetical protein
VQFDILHLPLPNIPAPNDLATLPDPSSRTGRRLNASTVAPTYMEHMLRAQFDELEGWGTTAPLTVSFTPEAGADPHLPAIDLDDLRARMQADGYDTTNDPVYLVNLTTGVPVLLDLGGGDFPNTLVDGTAYYPNDPHANANNLVLETNEEGAGLLQSDYKPSLDVDFDGVLDHPDTLPTLTATAQHPGIDDLMTWYEKETDTLIVRPMMPMDEMTEYAVVLTDRLRGPDGQPVRSPFEAVYHPQQQPSVAKLQAILNDPTRSNYYGDIAGSGLQHVAFAWTFTTEPVQQDMELLRDGLYGKGPFARVAGMFPPKLQLFPTAGTTLTPDLEPKGWQTQSICPETTKRPFIVHWADIAPAIKPVIQQLFPLSDTQTQGLLDSLDNVDYFVVGTYQTPYFIGDPKSTNPYDHFDANFLTGAATIHADTGHFWISVPKAGNGGAKAPFPLAFWHHGTTLFDVEMFIHAGRYAKQGLALASIDAPGHGLVLTQGQAVLVQALLAGQCLAPFTNALNSGRAIDLNGDGIADSGGLIWSAHLARTRDNVRQGVLDAMQMTRILKSFDGKTTSGQDFNGDGNPNDDLAGDFNGDGVVDVAGSVPGTDAPIYASGGSLGGIMSMIQGAIDPNVVAAAPVSGTAGFMDTAMRGTVTPVPVLEQVMGPLIVGVPASSRTDGYCTGSQTSVRWVVNDLFNSKEIEIACLNPSEIGKGKTVVITNYANGLTRCGRTGDGGTFRVTLPVSIGDQIDIQVIDKADAVDSYATCNVTPGAPLGRRITTWEQPTKVYTPVADPSITCPTQSATSNGCAQFRETFYPVGSTLVAPQEGVGYARQTPDFRRQVTLSASITDPADPFNYARYYSLRSLPRVDGSPQPARPLLVVTTAGDDEVTTASGLAFARAAGALPFLPPSAVTSMPDYADWATPESLFEQWGGATPDQVLVSHYEMEGVSRLARAPGSACSVNYVPSSTCTSAPAPSAQTCQDTLFDGDWLGETQQTYGQQHEVPPLRLVRIAGEHVTSEASAEAAWAPRATTTPFSPDTQGWKPNQPVIASVTAYIQPTGQHDWSVGDPCQSFDSTTYMDNLLAHFFVSGGQDLYYLSHPSTHACLASSSCPFFTP